MRIGGFLVVLAAAAAAQGETKEIKGPEGRVLATVPDAWRPQPISGSIILRSLAPGSHGGHDLIIAREMSQSDVDKQRDRYIQYDSGRFTGAEVKKFKTPFFGYRLNATTQNQVLVRAFLADGADGLVVSVSSRLQNYDRYWADKIVTVVASVRVKGGLEARRPELEGESRRVFDKEARVSVVAPGIWRAMESDDTEDVLFLGLKGSRKGPTMRIVDWGTQSNAGLVLLTLANRWKKSYGNITRKRLSNDPPTMLVRNRREGWNDYIIAFTAGGRGYTFITSSREGSFDRYRELADKIAKTIVFTASAYHTATEWPGDVAQPYKKFAIIHAAAEHIGTAEKLGKLLGGFEKAWRGIRLGRPRKDAPVHIVLVDEAGFEEASHGFGEKPAAYDRSTCSVVVEKPPTDKELLASWKGAVFGALTECVLHRDLKAQVPPWLAAGLGTCMNAAGRSGKGPDEGHPALVKHLDIKTATDSHMPLSDVLALTQADFLNAPDINNVTMAWGYTHLMLFGRGSLSGIYRKWSRVLSKSTGQTPGFDVKNYDQAEADLKKHVFKNWGK